MLERQVDICPICKQMVAKTPKNMPKVGNIQKIQQNSRKSLQKQHKNTENPVNIQNIQKEALGHQSPIENSCTECNSSFWGLWAFGWREGVLEKLVEEYKYQSVRAMGDALVELYDAILPQSLENIIIVPLPTIGRHVRERGFDHTLTLAKKLAKRRGWKCEQVLSRAVDTVQVGAKMAERKTQAAKAYAVTGKINPHAHYLLLDDVWTTGSTLLSAEKVLRQAGAQQISATVLAISKAKTE